MDKNHNEFLEEVKDAVSLPAQTCRALSPESEEDIAMYAEESNHSPLSREVAPTTAQCQATSRGDELNDVDQKDSEGDKN